MAPPTNPEQESEALHLKTIAESKFKASNNAKSALKYSKHAQRLCPQNQVPNLLIKPHALHETTKLAALEGVRLRL
ncbi:hypothetical protein JHK85_037713 [Glycine max]|nr:hypothetical protein JHK85_037713 [Glycine max]